VQAIKYGMPESKVSMNKFNISNSKRMPLSILLAVKQMLINKKKTITTTITITILIYVAFIINSTGYTLGNDDHLITNLLGMQVGDFTVTNSGTTNGGEFIDVLESVDSVESAVLYNISLGESAKGVEKDEVVSISSILIYGDYPEDCLKVANGRQPENDFEIVISSSIAEKTGKTTGDYLAITKGDEEINFFISGVINTISNGGNTYIRLFKEVPTDMDLNSGIYWVYSKEEHVIIDEMEDIIGGLVDTDITVSKYDSNVKNILSTIESFPIMIRSLLTIFLIISGVIILNFTIMDIHNSTRSFGIMKATGYSTGSITKMMVIKSVLLTTIGVLLGFVLNLLTVNLVMQGVFSITPFSSITLPVLFDGVGSMIMMGMFVIIAVIATLIPARRISKISPKILMTE
jgi:putative ABC transport system permease protein